MTLVLAGEECPSALGKRIVGPYEKHGGDLSCILP